MNNSNPSDTTRLYDTEAKYDHLHTQVTSLRSAVTGLHSDAVHSNRLLNNVDDSFASGDSLIGSLNNSIGRLFGGQDTVSTFWIVVGFVSFVLILWWLLAASSGDENVTPEKSTA